MALVLMVAVAGPGLAVYATEGEVPAEPDSAAVLPVEEVVEPQVPVVEVPEAEQPAGEPVIEPQPVLEAPVEPVIVRAEASVETPITPVFGITPAVAPVTDENDSNWICAGGVKLDENPRSGTYVPSTPKTEETPTTPTDYSITITTYPGADGAMLMNFTSNYPVSYVKVKGSDAAQFYSYDPPVYSATGLHAPVNASGKYADISHIVFCFGEEQPPELTDLTVYKFEDLNSNGVFDDEPMLEGWEFTLYDSEDAVVDSGTTDVSGMVVFSGLAAGEYYVIETLISGWANTTPLTQSITLPSETPWLYFGNVEEFLPFTWLDLAITKVADDHTVTEGQLVTYTLTYWNEGNLPAEDYWIVDDFDERYVSVVNANGGSVSGGKITWTFPGPLSKEMGQQTLTYTVRVIADMPVGTTNIDNVVVIDHPRDDDKKNNVDDERIVVRITEDDPFLPFTGGEFLLLIIAAIIAGTVGLALRLAPRKIS
jgi:hypothetical protein